MRCQWKPVQGLGISHNKHLPGECRECWKPCFNTVEEGQHCPKCFALLAVHPNPTVRAALANEEDAPSDILELLASDLQTTVSIPAADTLRRRHPQDSDSSVDPTELWDMDW